ncbi:hypothetical protein EMIT0210MI2_12766 [Priestia megaterium]
MCTKIFFEIRNKSIAKQTVQTVKYSRENQKGGNSCVYI